MENAYPPIKSDGDANVSLHAFPITSSALNYDRVRNILLGKLTGGLSPFSFTAAYMDWAVHLATSPSKQIELFQKAFTQLQHLARCAPIFHCGQPQEPCIKPLPQDSRFNNDSWQIQPFSFIYQSFLLMQQWWHIATVNVRGVDRHHEKVVNFGARQILDVVSPSNFIFTNPEILKETWQKNGSNLIQGAWNWWQDWNRQMSGQGPIGIENFRVGKDIAVTPGKVVYRNNLIELIQYVPTTDKIYPEPVLIIPSWIMKYYILDLSPHNSLVKYLVDRGHTVFIISWRNPDSKDRDIVINDYLQLGPICALEAIQKIIPDRQVNAVGYCLGGTLMAIAAAYLVREKKDYLASLSLLAAQTDFEEPGELALFMDESQVTFLDDIMWDQGYLDGKQMAGTFQLLNSRDLIWSKVIFEYLMGQRRPLIDLMAWNSDSTKLPYRMHAQYLRSFYLNNDLAHGNYYIGGKPISLGDITVPLFVVSTVRDHVSPWRSVYKIHLLTNTEITFVLTNGGHNAGIVNEPGHKGRNYQLMTQTIANHYLAPEEWQSTAPQFDGSWWQPWEKWLAKGQKAKVAPPVIGNRQKGLKPLDDAPGHYVFN